MSYEVSKEGKYTVHTYHDGEKRWLLNGVTHREDGPAVVYASGTKIWILNGQYHREDGPAIERDGGEKEWHLNDILVYSDFENKLKDYPDVSEEFKRSIIKYELRRS